MSIKGLDATVGRCQEWSSLLVLEGQIRRTRDEISRQCGTALEVLNRNSLGIKSGGFMICEISRVLREAGKPVYLRGLLDRRAIELPVGADTEPNTGAVEG